jgi:hypothetical protein
MKEEKKKRAVMKEGSRRSARLGLEGDSTNWN